MPIIFSYNFLQSNYNNSAITPNLYKKGEIMKCPHCNTAINVSWTKYFIYEDKEKMWDFDIKAGKEIRYGHCPECHNLIILLVSSDFIETDMGEYHVRGHSIKEDSPYNSVIIFPKFSIKTVAPEVPKNYAKDYKEASAILEISPKASAAMSRRMLQTILREKYGVKKRNLDKEIDEFISSNKIPSYISDTLHYLRIIGNFAAHPDKCENTGAIVEVEKGEAEWSLETLDALFDFVFVQPAKIEARKKKLNDKLIKIGKKPLSNL